MSRELLLVVDMQNDFMPGGALAVPEGDAIVPLVNRLAGRFAHVEQDLAPRIDDQRVAKGVAAILVVPGLGRGDDEQAGLDRTRAQQDVPVRAPRGNREGGGDRDDGQ